MLDEEERGTRRKEGQGGKRDKEEKGTRRKEGQGGRSEERELVTDVLQITSDHLSP